VLPTATGAVEKTDDVELLMELVIGWTNEISDAEIPPECESRKEELIELISINQKQWD
jgi:hypothetical protein